MSLVEILKIIVIGIVEGLTEWLPISSTGHMILVNEIIKMDMSPEFTVLFMTVIQLGAAFAITILYFKRLNPFDPRKKPQAKKQTWELLFKIAIASVPAAVIGYGIDDWVEENLETPFVVGAMLIIYGILFIVIENKNRYKVPTIDRITKIDYSTALYIGMFQCLALIPGASRSGTTILAAILLGLARPVAVEFSFLMGIPVIIGASGLKLVKYSSGLTGAEIGYLLIGILIVFIASLYTIRFFIGWIKKNDFKFFGYYRIILGVIVLLWFGMSFLVK